MPFALATAPKTFRVILVVVWALALLSIALAYILYFHLFKNIGVTKSLTVTYLILLLAMFWGKITLDETISVFLLVGCGLILSSAMFALAPSKSQ